MTIERNADYRGACWPRPFPRCDGILATAQPLGDLVEAGHVTEQHRTYLSLNRDRSGRLRPSRAGRPAGGQRPSARLVTDGSGVNATTTLHRPGRPGLTAPSARTAGPGVSRAGAGRRARGPGRAAGSGVTGGSPATPTPWCCAAVVAHDMGAPVIKVPVPRTESGDERRQAVARVVASVGVPVLFLGGPVGRRLAGPGCLAEVRDVMDGGGHGMAHGPADLPGPRPRARWPALVAELWCTGDDPDR